MLGNVCVKTKFACVLGGLLVAGCADFVDVPTAPQPVTFTSERAKTAAKTFTQSEFRFVQSTERGVSDDKEVVGARCVMKGDGFGATFNSPAILMMPAYVGDAGSINVTCRANERSVAQDFKPVNVTLQRIQQAPVPGVGLVGALVTAAAKGIATSARDPLKDEFNYPPRVVVVDGVK